MGRLKFLLFITINSIASAQVTTEQLYNGASSYSMAGSDLALPAHSWSMFVNPAGLAEGDHTTAIFGIESLYGLSYFSHASAGVQFTLFGLGAFGLSIEDLATNYEGNSLSKETALALHHGLTLQADRNSTLRFGYSLKAYSVDYGMSAGPSGDGSDGISLGSHQAFGLDAGVLASLRERIRFGAKITNINRPQLGAANTAVYLPTRMQIGLAYSPYDLVWTTAALTRSVRHDTQIHAGMNYKILPGFLIRSGVHSNPNRFATGFSITWKFISINYGLMTHPVLPFSHNLSFEILMP